MRKFVLSFLLIAGVCCTAQGAIIPAVQDSYIFSVSPGQNYGSEDVLLVKNEAPTNDRFNRKTYIQFDPTGALTATGVTLRLNVVESGLGTSALPYYLYDFEVFGILQPAVETWNENSIVWNNAPANQDGGTGLDTSKVVSLGVFTLSGKGLGEVGLNTVALRQYFNTQAANGQTLDLIIRRNTPLDWSDGDYVHAFASRDNALLSGPELDVTATPEPMTFGTAGLVLGLFAIRKLRTASR